MATKSHNSGHSRRFESSEEAGLVSMDGGLQRLLGVWFVFLMVRGGAAWFSSAAIAKRSALLLLMLRCRVCQLFQNNRKTTMF